jgi:3-oxoacyl-[acyl-carrier protein] reductase
LRWIISPKKVRKILILVLLFLVKINVIRKKANLKDQVAIITGAASGIGRAIALRLSQEKAKVAILDLNFQDAQKVVKTIKSSKGEAVAFKTDISKPQQVRLAVKKVIQKYGRINILVNNVGISLGATLLDNDVKDKWDQTLAANLTGAFLVTESVVKKMVKNNWPGSIINITSVHSQAASANGAYYTVTKAGLAGATKSWALELADYGIRVNAIAPGAIINTGMNKNINRRNEKEKARKINIPLKRFGRPEEIADAAVFLATSDYITGQEIFVDGGYLLNH